MWVDVIEIGITVVLFLCSSYLLYYKAFLKSFGNETAKLLTVEEYTRLQEDAKEEYNNRLAELKADLDKRNTDHSIQYSLLHTKRAEVIVEVNRLLSVLLKNVEAFTNPYIPGNTEEKQNKELKDRLESLNKAYDNFMAYYDYNKLFFKRSFCDTIETLLVDTIDVCRKQNVFNMKVKSDVLNNPKREDDLNTAFEVITEKIRRIRASKLDLENDFRSLLCVEDA